MKKIQINLGQILVIDNDDWERVKKHSWSTWWCKKRCNYACPKSTIDGKYIVLSRWLLNAPTGLQVDHINRNTLDNRRQNLRLCDNSLNNHNKGLFRNNVTGFMGVYFDKYHKKYRAEIRIIKKVFLGYFDNKEEASKVYQLKKKEYLQEKYYKNDKK